MEESGTRCVAREAHLYITITIATGASCYRAERRLMSNSTQVESRPWEMPIWKPVRGKENVLLYLITIHVLAVIGLILYPVPGIPVFVTALVFISSEAWARRSATTVIWHTARSSLTRSSSSSSF